MIRSLNAFIDTSAFTATFVSKHRSKFAGSGVLPLRHWIDEAQTEVADRPLLEEWGSARSLLKRIRAEAAASFGGQRPELGLAWIDHLAAEDATAWTREEGDYADEIIRIRICLIPSPGGWSFSGAMGVLLPVGAAHAVDHKLLCSEINLGPAPRTHLVVDIRKPVEEEPAGEG